MKKYKHVKEKKATERVSFYIALSVCMMAVGFAVWSAYTTLSDTMEPDDNTYFSSLSTEQAAAAQEMTGVTVGQTEAATAPAAAVPTEAATESRHSFVLSETMPPEEEDGDLETEMTSLQAVLRVADNLVYPVKSRSVVKQYSEDSVYNATMRDYRPHTGCDFAAEQGESVYAMCDGTVSNISVSELYGTIIEVNCGDFSVYYCGLDTDFPVSKGDEVKAGDTVGTVGQIPCESEDEPHVHVEIRVGKRLIDPLSVIDSDS